MKTLLIYIFLLLPCIGFAQQNSPELEYKTFKESQSPVLIKSSSIDLDRDIYTTPLQQRSLEETLINIMKDSLVIDFYDHILKQEIKLNLKDTLMISEKDITYISGRGIVAYSGKELSFDINNAHYVHDSLMIDVHTTDTLQGLYKIEADLSNKNHYDYYLGYILKGSPYLEGVYNVFEYYKNEKLIKRRYFIRTHRYSAINTENYVLLSKNQWQREIRTWPTNRLLVRDTVSTDVNKTSDKKKFLVIYEKIIKRNNKLNDGTRILDSIYNKIYLINEGKKFEVERLTLSSENQTKLNLNKNIEYVENFDDYNHKLYTKKDRGMKRGYKNYIDSLKQLLQENITGNFENRFTISSYINDIRFDTLEYKTSYTYIEGKQNRYYYASYLDSSLVSQSNTYQQSELKTIKVYLRLNYNLLQNYDFDLENEDEYGILLINIDNGSIKNINIKYFNQFNKIVHQAEFKNIQNRSKVKKIKEYQLNQEYLEDDILNKVSTQDLCLVPTGTHFDNYYPEQKVSTEYQQGRIIRRITTYITNSEKDSIGIQGKSIPIYEIEVEDYKKRTLTTEIRDRISYHLIARQTIKKSRGLVYDSDNHYYFKNKWRTRNKKQIWKVKKEYFDRQTGKLISKKEYTEIIK